MSHHHYSDGQVGEEREFYGVSETSEGEREYYEHVRTPRASTLNTAITVSVILLVLSIAFGYRTSTAPAVTQAQAAQAAQAQAAPVQKIMTAPPVDSCSELSPYAGRDC
ncbi:hypothetical protein PY650_08500 [Rhizobium calliandrae]|uniref:Transmembrane protein n=1 Tax=Rhizobium calliandrae TaxID=1312182 RepID=A0ABT7KAR0_9HYPH|nr:hypothetical protein [Rhizobium calliandrae]MDL2405705.1 hypothetical protein [Rhizobium calliandrae]